MAEEDKNNDLERVILRMNKGHGYAGVFNSDNSDDKRIVEEFTIEEWRRSIKAEFGIEIDSVLPNPDDPPDFFVTIKGQRMTVELVQLVEQEHKRRAAKNETPFAGRLFLEMQWSRDRFISKLNDVIFEKREKYKKIGLEIDVLLIHTGEPWLRSTQAKEWIEDGTINKYPSIRSVFLLFDYEPSRCVDHWAVICIYGKLTK